MDNYYRHTADSPYHLSVGAVVVNADKQILCHYFPVLQQLGREYRDFYLLMRETVEPGETLEVALARGLMEEFGATAKPTHFLGSLVANRLVGSGGFELQKTTLYFLCALESFNASRRAADDPEASSEIGWREPNDLIAKMKEQGQRLGREDADESAIIERAKAHLR